MREPYLKEVPGGLSKQYFLSDNSRLSDSFYKALTSMVSDINKICGTTIALDIDKNRDILEINKLYQSYYSAYKDSRIGEEMLMNNGLMAEIIEYRSCADIDVRFENGEIVSHKYYSNFRKGNIALPGIATERMVCKNSREGKIINSERFGPIKVLQYVKCCDCTVKFERYGTIRKHVIFSDVVKNRVTPYECGKRYDRVGETSVSKGGQRMTIIAYHKASDIDVKFDDGEIVCHKSYHNFKTGNISCRKTA